MEARSENKMGTMPVKRLIVSMSLPMMISMLVQALYNVVDSVFVARVSEDALTAVTLAFPMQSLMIAISGGTGVGVNALLSRSLGEKKFERADKAANMAILLNIIHVLLFMLIGIFLSGPFIRTQTTDPAIAAYGQTYLSIVCTLCVGLMFQVTFERLLQSTGRTLYSMFSQLLGAVVNLIMDPIMIFGYFGFPALGVAGAAYATVLGQMMAAVLGLFLNLFGNKEVHFSLRSIIKPHTPTIKQIYYVGVPSMIMMSIGSVMTYALNKILMGFSATATAVFGAYFKLQSFFFMPIFGLNNGLIPVLSYNYGARNKERINEALKFSVKLALGIMITGSIILFCFPRQLLALFNASDDMLAIGVPALRIICVHFPVAAICIVMGSIFQAFAKSIYSLITSVARQIVILIPVAWLLAQTGVLNNVWWCFLIAEFASLIVSSILFRKLYGSVVATM